MKTFGRLVVSFMLRKFFFPERTPGTSSTKGWAVPSVTLGQVSKREVVPMPGIEFRSFGL
jgi:hypothetical protein